MKLFIIILLCVVGTQGGPAPKVIGGITVAEGEAPWHVHLNIRPVAGSSDVRVGSAVLISTTRVLTVAQNVRNFGHWRMGVGSSNFANLIWFETTNAVQHPNYDHNTLNNNIAVLITPLISGVNISPIALPTTADINLPQQNQEGFFTGFGFTSSDGPFSNMLLRGFQTIMSPAACLDSYPHMNAFIANYFCGSDFTNNICAGDQGTAYVQSVRLTSTLLGLASFTNVNCQPLQPAAFVRVPVYLTWITSI